MKAVNKKILHVRHSMGGGGITTFVESLLDLNSLIDTVHDILVWKEKPDPSSKHNILDISTSSNRKKEFDNIIKTYDKIFVHSLMPFMIFSLLKRRQDVFLFQHGITFGSGPKSLIKKTYYFCVINLLKINVICSSDFAKQKLFNKVMVFDKSLIKIIGFGIELNDNTKSNGSIDNILRIGFAGRLVEQKKVSRIFEALRNIDDTSFIEFHIAGDGPLFNDLQNQAKTIENDNISFVFHGFTSNMDLFYSKLDLFILPSIRESFGLVVLEALSRNVPTIVFKDSGACVEFVKNGINGFIVENEMELMQKMKALSDFNLKNKLKSNIDNMNFFEYDIVNTRAKLDKL